MGKYWKMKIVELMELMYVSSLTVSGLPFNNYVAYLGGGGGGFQPNPPLWKFNFGESDLNSTKTIHEVQIQNERSLASNK